MNVQRFVFNVKRSIFADMSLRTKTKRQMKKNILGILLLTLGAVFLLPSCGEDRSGEYYEKTQENQWIYTTMQEHYLWGDSLPSLERNQYFSTTSKFFSSLLHKGDKVSFFNDTISAGSYGLTFALMRDPLGVRPGKVYAMVLNAHVGSPAYNAGIRRGTWITSLDGKALSTSSSAMLTSGNAVEVVTEYIDYDDETGEYFWENGDTLSMLASCDYTIDAVAHYSTINIRDRKVGYLVLDNMTGDSFIDNTQDILLGFAGADVTDVVLDLRYCNGGTLPNATSLASSFVPSTAFGTPFCSLVGKGEVVDTVYNYSAQVANLSDKNLYVILGSRTHGVAELLASSLKNTPGLSGVITLGAGTAGGGMMTAAIQAPYGFTINPVVSIMLDAASNEIPSTGVEADCVLDELANPFKVHPLGSEQENILYNTMYLIVNGMLPE